MVSAQDSTHPTGVSSTTGNQPEVLRARERKAYAALDLVLVQRKTWDDAAELLGYPTARHAKIAAEQVLENELKTGPNQLAMRAMAGKKLDMLLDAVWDQAMDRTDENQLAAVGKARELIGDFRKLFGTDAPAEVIQYTPTQAEITRLAGEYAKMATPNVEEDDIFTGGYDDDFDAQTATVPGEIIDPQETP